MQKVDLKEGTRIKIVKYTERDTESLSELARQFAGIGGYKEPIDSEKLYQTEEELYG